MLRRLYKIWPHKGASVTNGWHTSSMSPAPRCRIRIEQRFRLNKPQKCNDMQIDITNESLPVSSPRLQLHLGQLVMQHEDSIKRRQRFAALHSDARADFPHERQMEKGWGAFHTDRLTQSYSQPLVMSSMLDSTASAVAIVSFTYGGVFRGIILILWMSRVAREQLGAWS